MRRRVLMANSWLFEPYGASSLLVLTWMHQSEALAIVLCENQWEDTLYQGFPELLCALIANNWLFEPYGAWSLLVLTWMHQSETLVIVLYENQWEDTLYQGFPELLCALIANNWLFEPYGACSLLVLTWMHKSETLVIALYENQWEDTLYQSFPELLCTKEKSSGVEIALVLTCLPFCIFAIFQSTNLISTFRTVWD